MKTLFTKEEAFSIMGMLSTTSYVYDWYFNKLHDQKHFTTQMFSEHKQDLLNSILEKYTGKQIEYKQAAISILRDVLKSTE